MGEFRLESHRRGRTRLRRAQHIAYAPRSRSAVMCDCAHDEGQRRELHGKQCALALSLAPRRRARGGTARARRNMRDAFIRRLTEMAGTDPRIMLLTADLGFGVIDGFAREFPRQFVNVGVAEQNMTGIATGLALEGHIVFTYSIANFPV